MAYTQLATKTSAATVASADVNTLQANIEALKGGTGSVAPTTTIEGLSTSLSGKVSKTESLSGTAINNTNNKVLDELVLEGYSKSGTKITASNKIVDEKLLTDYSASGTKISGSNKALDVAQLKANLTTSSAGSPLDATQGKVLADRLFNVLEKSADYIITDTDPCEILGTTNASNITFTLPTFADNIGKVYTIWKVDSGTGRVFIRTESSTELINGVRADGALGTAANTAIPRGASGYGGIGAQYHALRIKIFSSTAAGIVEHVKPYEKTYIVGQTYNGVAISISTTYGGGTPVSSPVTRYGYFTYCNTIDGLHFLNGSFFNRFTGVTSTQWDTTITGVTFKNATEQYMANAVFTDVTGYRSLTVPNTGTIQTYTTSASNSGHGASFSYLQLESKPTWAD